MQPDDPASIGPYRLSARLGEGGMGQVFLAVSRSGRRLAVKVIRPQIAADPGFRERFRREVAAARTVGGFWTAPIVDADPEGAVPWVASDYIDAPDLAALVRDRGALPEPALRSLAAGLAEALEAVHRAGLVHRDLKPSNILVTGTGPRVIDFGISKAVEGATALTDTGLVVGTPGYMSPEQATGAPVGPPSDIFALGTVLVYAATGRAPFGEGAAPALLYRVVHDRPALGGVPGSLRALVAACLEKAPERRPSASQVLDLLSPATPAPGPVPGPRPGSRTSARAETRAAGSPVAETDPDAAKAPETAPAPETARPKAARVPEPVGAPEAAGSDETVEVSAGLSDGPGRRPDRGGCLAVSGAFVAVPGAIVLAFFAPWPVAALTAALGLLGFLLGGALIDLAPPVRRTVLLTADRFHWRSQDRRWSLPWLDVTHVTVRPAKASARGERHWRLTVTVRPRGGLTVPADFAGEGEQVGSLPLEFDASEDPRPALGRLDEALRRYAGVRYSPDPSLTAYLDRS
ncbi:protein kinase [Streptomyces sp. NPDC007818]|uniref:protein kinase domain-containing protein n=1 Tax=Streptomyces sp. NPDC007818 TaxID=3364780 RepID=UPI0036B62339